MSHKCPECGKTYASAMMLTMHVNSHKARKGPKAKASHKSLAHPSTPKHRVYACALCRPVIMFKTRAERIEHFRDAHPIDSDKLKAKPASRAIQRLRRSKGRRRAVLRRHPCPHCNDNFSSEHALNTHMGNHGKLLCTGCSETFYKIATLDQHCRDEGHAYYFVRATDRTTKGKHSVMDDCSFPTAKAASEYLDQFYTRASVRIQADHKYEIMRSDGHTVRFAARNIDSVFQEKRSCIAKPRAHRPKVSFADKIDVKVYFTSS